jgi:hypothetical protein
MEESVAEGNTSGQRGAEPPEEVRGRFHWGAFGLGCVWALWHRLWDVAALDIFLLVAAWWSSSLVFLAIVMPQFAYEEPVGPWMPAAAVACMALFLMWRLKLGHRGYAMAWQHRHFRDLEDFRSTEQAWKGAGVLVAVVMFGKMAWEFGAGWILHHFVGGAGIH